MRLLRLGRRFRLNHSLTGAPQILVEFPERSSAGRSCARRNSMPSSRSKEVTKCNRWNLTAVRLPRLFQMKKRE